jgi:hypothetical protein
VSNYPPDPGGVFASDYHRRVAAHTPLPEEDAITAEELLERLHGDSYTGLWYRDEDREPLALILDDLQQSGYVRHLDGSDGWKLTADGLGCLAGPALTEVNTPDQLRSQLAANLGDGEPADEATVEKAVKAGEKAGTIVVQDSDDDGNPLLVRFEALPLTGPKLEEAERHDERMAKEDEEIDKRVAKQAVEETAAAHEEAKKFAEEVGA